MNIAVDDLGASAAKKYDCEAWLPGQGRYRELTSTLEHDRLPGPAPGDPLPRPADGGGPRSLHTLNGTAVAVGRTIIALLENGQQRGRLGRAARVPARATGAPAVLPPAGPAPPSALERRARASAWMSNVVSSRVISNRRRTVGFEHTSAMRPPRRVTRRSAVEQDAQPGRVDELDVA